MEEGEGDPHDFDIMLRRGLLNDDAWLQRVEGGQKSAKKWLCNNKCTLPYVKRVFMNPQTSKSYDVIIDITAYQKISFLLFLLNGTEYQDETYWNISITYEQHFQHIFSSVLKPVN